MLTSLSNGIVFCEVEGSSSNAIVFLHGWGRSRADFSAMAKEAAGAGFITASIDLPGFGATPPPEVGVGTDWYREVVARAICDFVEKNRVARIAIVGHSFGGRIALKIASELSSNSLDLGAQCVGVMISGVPLFRDNAASRAPLALRMLKAAVRLKVVPKSRLERYRNNHGSADYRRAEGVMRETFVKVVNEDYSNHLRGIERVPLILFWGKDDASAPFDQAQRAVELAKGSRLIAVSGDHFTFLGEANDVVKELSLLFEL